jgi:hypothetical protein
MHGIYTGYGDSVNQQSLGGTNGKKYLERFPKLDRFKSCKVEAAPTEGGPESRFEL